MSRIAAVILAIVLSGTPAAATSECEAYFDSIGRTFMPDAPGVKVDPGRGGGVLDCPAEQMMQFTFDVAAADRAKPVASADQMIGTWVSDDVLGVVTGLFIPVFEVIEIEAGDAEGELKVTQKLYRPNDPAGWYASPESMGGPTDLVAAGRIATYGEHVIALPRPGELALRHVRYHDFPVESERLTGLIMKTRFLSLQQMTPIGVATDGERLVFTLFDRMARGDRIMTFRKRQAESPARALKMAVVGEISFANFHCFIEAMERPTPAFTSALDQHTHEAFFAAIDEADQLNSEYETILRETGTDATGEQRKAVDAAIRRIGERLMEMTETGPLGALQAEGNKTTPFDCPKPY